MANSAVTEGIRNSVSIHKLGEIHKIDMPICKAVFQILHEGVSSFQALQNLLDRDLPD